MNRARNYPVKCERKSSYYSQRIKGDRAMRVMVMGKATKETEAGVMPTTVDFAAMERYNEELVKAGVILAGDGLRASALGVRIYFTGDKRTVVDGPFTEAK